MRIQGDADQGTAQEFSLSWTHAWPFGWEGKTHFLMTTVYPVVYAVVIPSWGAAPGHDCLLREFLR